MRKNSLVFQSVVFCALLFSSGCFSVPNSPSPRFHMLSSVDKEKVSQKFNIPSYIIIETGPVKIPDYQNRPQMVTLNKDKTLNFAQFDRWGEALDSAMARLINESLTAMLPGATFQMFPCNFNIPLKYQLIVDVLQLESELDKEVFFSAQWSIIDVETKKMAYSKRSEFRQPIDPHNYAGMADALSAVCVSLSREVAQEFEALTKQL